MTWPCLHPKPGLWASGRAAHRREHQRPPCCCLVHRSHLLQSMGWMEIKATQKTEGSMRCHKLRSQHLSPRRPSSWQLRRAPSVPLKSHAAAEETRRPGHMEPLKARQKLQGQRSAGFTFLRGPNKSFFPPCFPGEMPVRIVTVLNCWWYMRAHCKGLLFLEELWGGHFQQCVRA